MKLTHARESCTISLQSRSSPGEMLTQPSIIPEPACHMIKLTDE